MSEPSDLHTQLDGLTYRLEQMTGEKNRLERQLRTFTSPERTVAETQIENVRVSTVVWGFDHHHLNAAEPVLFETMIFGGKYDRTHWRARSRKEADLTHRLAVALVQRYGGTGYG